MDDSSVDERFARANGRFRTESLDDKLGLWLRLAHRHFTYRVNDYFAAQHVTQADYLVLGLINHNAGCRQIDISQLLDIKPQNLAKIVDYLVERKYAFREADPNDRRSNRLFITSGGLQCLVALDRSYGRVSEEILTEAGLSSARDFVELLRAVAKSGAAEAFDRTGMTV
jgi:DNA-binding MarR family transcriptional regulator